MNNLETSKTQDTIDSRSLDTSNIDGVVVNRINKSTGEIVEIARQQEFEIDLLSVSSRSETTQQWIDQAQYEFSSPRGFSSEYRDLYYGRISPFVKDQFHVTFSDSGRNSNNQIIHSTVAIPMIFEGGVPTKDFKQLRAAICAQ